MHIWLIHNSKMSSIVNAGVCLCFYVALQYMSDLYPCFHPKAAAIGSSTPALKLRPPPFSKDSCCTVSPQGDTVPACCSPNTTTCAAVFVQTARCKYVQKVHNVQYPSKPNTLHSSQVQFIFLSCYSSLYISATEIISVMMCNACLVQSWKVLSAVSQPLDI